MSEGAMPFNRGEYWATAPAGILGSEFDLGNGTTLMVVKNTDAAALSPKRVVKWEDQSAFEVDYATAASNGPMVAGVVDELYTGQTIPVNAAFYIVRRGNINITMGTAATDPAAGGLVVVDDAAAKGCIGGIEAIGATMNASTAYVQGILQSIGVAQAAVATGPADVEVMLDIRGA